MASSTSSVLLRWEGFFEELEAFIRSSTRQQGCASLDYAHFAVERFELIITSLARIVDIFGSNQPQDEETRGTWHAYVSTLLQLVDACRSLTSQWDTYIDRMQSNPYPHNYLPPLVRRPHVRGRPPFAISQDQLLYLSSLSFTWTEIASLLGVSRMTIYRRRCDFNMLELRRDAVTDAQLRTMIRSLKCLRLEKRWWLADCTPVDSVTRERVRCAICAVDPLNTSLQAPHGLTRRQCYSVPAPNSLWHIGEPENSYRKTPPPPSVLHTIWMCCCSQLLGLSVPCREVFWGVDSF